MSAILCQVLSLINPILSYSLEPTFSEVKRATKMVVLEVECPTAWVIPILGIKLEEEARRRAPAVMQHFVKPALILQTYRNHYAPLDYSPIN